MNLRLDQRESFAQKHGVPFEGWQALAADASVRRYFRISATPFGPCLLMDDPGGSGGFDTYVRVARHLVSLGLSAPVVHASDSETGLALIEDFGAGTYTNLLAQGQDEAGLYELAIDTLVALHDSDNGRKIDLPPYDMDALMREVMLFADWFAPLLSGAGDNTPFRCNYEALWRAALADVADRREVLVLRDYHVDNLMQLPGRKGVAACGVLDFQDGLIGAAAYDVMSLTQDARRDLSPGLEQQLLERYFAARPNLDRADFLRAYHLLAAQRHAKVAGIFLRLSRRDGKHHYLRHVQRVLKLLDRALRSAALDDLSALLDGHLSGWTEWTPAGISGARA